MRLLKNSKFRTVMTFLLVFAIVSLTVPLSASAPTPSATSTSSMLPDEVNQYQGIPLTTINDYKAYLKAHPDVAIKGTQTIDQATYKLAITGMVNNPGNYSYNEVVNLSSTQQVATLPCVEGWSVTMLWQGIPLTELLDHAGGVGSDANTVIFIASDGYSSSLTLDYIKQNNIMIAYKMNNVTLTPQLGWPFFLVANNQYGYKWVEWITEISVSSDSNYLGYWESRGYPNNATVRDGQITSSFDYGLGVLVFVMLIVVAVIVGVLVYRRDKQHKNVYTNVQTSLK
jgi:DMSO/TMAO reductase YedYZ molybdopterin-dependent catalytic subunit